jgi:hypothetical protein
LHVYIHISQSMHPNYDHDSSSKRTQNKLSNATNKS